MCSSYLHMTTVVHLPVEGCEVAGGAKPCQPLTFDPHGRLRKVEIIWIRQLHDVAMIVVRELDREAANQTNLKNKQ